MRNEVAARLRQDVRDVRAPSVAASGDTKLILRAAKELGETASDASWQFELGEIDNRQLKAIREMAITNLRILVDQD